MVRKSQEEKQGIGARFARVYVTADPGSLLVWVMHCLGDNIVGRQEDLG
jgi:hypothetical protein